MHSHLLETKDEIVRDTYKQYKQPIPRIKKLVLDNDHVLMQNQFEQCQPKH
ncbi:hypothetical protein FACS1894166_13390 [Bacilli bacterium]|nr:hypothetical protein FACS1894166_13390 [Bacilli bacterium]